MKGEVKILSDKMVPFENEMSKFIDEHEADLNEHIIIWKDWVEYLKEPNLDEEEKLIGEEARKYHHGEKTRLNNEKKKIQVKINSIKAQIVVLEKKIKAIRDKRCKGNEGIIAKYENSMLVIAGIYLNLYHGGSLNGVCVLKFFRFHDEIMRVHELECLNSLGRRRDMMGVRNCITDEELRKQLAIFSRAYHAIDLVFSNLRLLDPTEEEMKRTEISVKILEFIWSEEIQINWTPKAMLTLVYAAKQQREFGGLGDKGEDYGERMHQSRARNVRRTASISKDFIKMETNHSRWEYAKADPKVKSTCEEVKISCMRRLKGVTKATKDKRLEADRRKRRDKFFLNHKHLADKSNL